MKEEGREGLSSTNASRVSLSAMISTGKRFFLRSAGETGRPYLLRPAIRAGA